MVTMVTCGYISIISEIAKVTVVTMVMCGYITSSNKMLSQTCGATYLVITGSQEFSHIGFHQTIKPQVAKLPTGSQANHR